MDTSTLGITLAVARKTATSTVTDWLNDHVDPETGYVIDDSLSVTNAAADAKAVGDALASRDGANGEYDTRINAIHALINYGYDVSYSGSASGGSGGPAYDVTVSRNKTLLTFNGDCGTSSTGLKMQLNSVDELKLTPSSSSALGGGITLTNDHKYRLRAHIVSGIMTGSISPAWVLPTSVSRIAGTSAKTDALTNDGYTDLTYSSTTYANGVRACLFLVRTGGNAMSNLCVEVTIEDLTVSRLYNLETRLTTAENAIPTVDNSLTTAGAAADAKKTGDEIAALQSAISGGGGGDSGTVIEECVVNESGYAVSTRTVAEIYNDFKSGKRVLFYIQQAHSLLNADEVYFALTSASKLGDDYNIGIADHENVAGFVIAGWFIDDNTHQIQFYTDY